ncbi:MAG: hypothetical protein JNK54_06490 [Elusimicrobia bacterium]|nr:hypothetical protein [Elusimicrobiota bacterium]
MKNLNEKNPSAKKSGRAFFCPLSSSARADTRQSGFVFAGLAEETIFDPPMIPVPLNIGQGVPPSRPFGSNLIGGFLYKSGSIFFVWQSHARETNMTVVK